MLLLLTFFITPPHPPRPRPRHVSLPPSPSLLHLISPSHLILPSLPHSERTTKIKSTAVTGDALDERAAAPVAVTVLSREVREAVEERSELEGNKEAEEGAEVEMWSEVVERRPRGSQPLIDCSRLAEALCVYRFKHKPRLLLCLIHRVMMEKVVIVNPDNLNLYPPKTFTHILKFKVQHFRQYCCRFSNQIQFFQSYVK